MLDLQAGTTPTQHVWVLGTGTLVTHLYSKYFIYGVITLVPKRFYMNYAELSEHALKEILKDALQPTKIIIQEA